MLLNADDGSSSSHNRISIRKLWPDVAERRGGEQQLPLNQPGRGSCCSRQTNAKAVAAATALQAALAT